MVMVPSNLKERLSVVEKQLNKRAKPTKNNAEFIARAEKLLAESRRIRAEQEAKNTPPLEIPQPISTPVEPVPEAVESLDEFEAWLGGVQDEN